MNTSITGRAWRAAPHDEGIALSLQRQLGLPRLAAVALSQRVGPADAADFLRPSLDHLHSPQAMRGMDVAVDRLQRAVVDRESMRIVTDYDVDGTTSSLILQGVLRLLGAKDRLSYHIPDRFVEGYGFSVRAAEQAAADGVRLIVTADIGVRDHAAVRRARELGVDVIVCDHHLPAGEQVPAEAVAVLCPPQAGCSYPNGALAACGVSTKLATALLSGKGRFAEPAAMERLMRSFLKVAAIGTIADVVDLSTLENRAIVALGLAELAKGGHTPGLTALLEAAGVKAGEPITSDTIGFYVGPRINAAGRLKKATAIIELFDEVDPAQARARAAELNRLNAERQDIQEELVALALAQVTDPPPAFVVVDGQEEAGWHRGVVGIVAAKVREAVHRPAAIVSVYGGFGHGSVRSTGDIHAVHALDAVSDLLLRYGGHAAAAGFTVKVEDIPALRSRLADWAAPRLGVEAPSLDVDLACALPELTVAAAEALAQLEPCGKGNPRPLLRLDGVRPSAVTVLKEKHLKFQVGGCTALWWRAAEHRDLLDGPVDLVAELTVNEFRGRRTPQLRIEDLRPSR